MLWLISEGTLYPCAPAHVFVEACAQCGVYLGDLFATSLSAHATPNSGQQMHTRIAQLVFAGLVSPQKYY